MKRINPLYYGAAVLMLLATACKKTVPGGVPLTQVNISINVNNPSYADLAVPTGWLYLTGGSQGIIVYRSSPDEFVAMDRHCPYQTADLCRVVVTDDNIVIRDTTCCNSAFLILDGSVTEGPAALPLHRYNTSFNGTTLRIYN